MTGVSLNDIRVNDAMLFSHSDSNKRRHIISAMAGDHDCASIDGQTKKIEKEGINATGTREIEKEKKREKRRANQSVNQSRELISVASAVTISQPEICRT